MHVLSITCVLESLVGTGSPPPTGDFPVPVSSKFYGNPEKQMKAPTGAKGVRGSKACWRVPCPVSACPL